jgi:hypothetical protein
MIGYANENQSSSGRATPYGDNLGKVVSASLKLCISGENTFPGFYFS